MSLKKTASKLFLLNISRAFVLSFFVFSVGCSNLVRHQEITDSKRFLADSERSAYSVWAELQQSGTDFNARAIVVGEDLTVGDLVSGVTYGAEKEASSQLITRVMGPTTDSLKEFLDDLPDEVRKEFYIDFLENYTKDSNGYRTYINDDGVKIDLAVDVRDMDNNPKLIDVDRLKLQDYRSATIEQLEEKFDFFLAQTEGRPLAFIKPSVRAKLFKGSLASLGGAKLPKNYRSYVPHFGLPERYIDNSHGHNGGNGGWEINFKPMGTYGEFEEMILWFRTELKNAGSLFQAPGHQRIVFRNHPDLNKKKLAELYRVIQALIVVEGINGNTGIESASYKSVHVDKTLSEGMDSPDLGRGVIRPEGDKWSPNTRAVEFRAGTKDLKLSRFYQTAFTSRIATNEFEDMSSIDEYDLVKSNKSNVWGNDSFTMSDKELKKRFGVPRRLAKKALSNIEKAGNNMGYMVPFWYWESEGNPYISASKAELLKSMTVDFIEKVAALDGDAESMKKDIRSIMRGWTKSSRVSEDLRAYIRPKKSAIETQDVLHFNSPNRAGRAGSASNFVDVNDIDLGIEYSGKFPLKLQADYSEEVLPDNSRAWLQTFSDVTDEERVAILEKISNDLSAAFGGQAPVKVEDANDHGHGLDIAFELRDEQDRKWRVEWDGIGRTYSPEGDVVEGSARGGSVELVTPKFVPNAEEIQKVYEVFDKNNILPDIKSGGGHINIDLAAFEGKPKQLARLLSVFNEHRGIIALMFQDYYRMKAGEPVDISDKLSRKLKNFNGSEEELKKLLYNEQYFNTRYGRKTRYMQFDLSAYFQDVIPEEFITEDFDISKPTENWRRQFRVDPKIRKGEFRLFNAPRDAFESALQIKLVRAMLDKALNDDGPLSGKVQNVDHVAYLDEPGKAMQDLEKLCSELGLDVNDYRVAMAEGLSDIDLKSKSKFFETHESRVGYYKKQPGWASAVDARAEPISSEGRQWTPSEVDELNTMTNDEKIAAARRAEELRGNISPNRQLPSTLQRNNDCAGSLRSLL